MDNSEEIGRRYPLELGARDFFATLIEDVKREVTDRHIDALNSYPKVELGLGIKGMKSWQAIASLFFGGFEEDAEIVLRSLVDVAVDMKFISLDPKARAQRFMDYEVIHRLRWLREGKRRLGLTDPDDQRRLQRIEKNLEPRVEEVLERQPQWKNRLPASWADEDTATKLDKINEPLLYLTYMLGCAQTHPNVVTVGGYFAPTEESVEILIDPCTPKQSRVFVDACTFLHRLIDHLNEIVHLRMDKRCDESRERVEELLRTRLPELGRTQEAMQR